MNDLIESFKTWLQTRVEKFRGKPLEKAEVSKSVHDAAPTKRYKIVKGTEDDSTLESYLITDSGEVLLQPGFLVGRGMSCHLKLTDPGTSRVHASFNRIREGWILKDNLSKNGTLVNREPVQSALLRPGDQIQIGQTLLVYEER